MFNESAYTGKLLESELLGKAKKPPLQEKELQYLPYRDAIQQVKNLQPGDPTDPTPRFSSDLHSMVADLLDLKDYSLLSLYTAIGTVLDRKHGVDAFLELTPEDMGKVARVTVDLTTNPHKDEYKADIILFIPEEDLDFLENKKGYNRLIMEAAEQITALLRERRGNEGRG